MRISRKDLGIVNWAARICATALILFGIPFYFGYGNPLPFANPDYTLFDNIWLLVFPLMFLGLGLGWRWKKIGGYLVVVPIAIAAIIGFLFLNEGLPWPMLFPLIVGVIYLIVGHTKSR